MVDWPWNNIINILSTFHNMINSLVSRKNCHLKVWMWLVSLSNLTKDPWIFHCSCEGIWKLKFCSISFPTWHLFTGDKLFKNFLKHQCERSWGFHHEVWRQTFQTSCKQRSGQNFSLLGWKGLPKTPNLLLKLKNLPVYNLLTIN